MQAVAKFEVQTDVSVFADDHWLDFRDSDGLYSARVRNIPRDSYSNPFLIEVHIYFEAEGFDVIAEIAEERLSIFMNMLVLATEGEFTRHRRRVIVDASPGKDMRDCLFTADALENDDPVPLLSGDVADIFGILSLTKVSGEVQRALRWVRLGLASWAGDDQYQCFWLALELLAGSKKATAPVPDVCPKCRQPLYCEHCQTHPTHMPFIKQKIRALIQVAMPGLDEKQIELFERARNVLAHGSTLREFEASNPSPEGEPHLVDKLYEVVRAAVLLEYPKEVQDRLNGQNRRESVVSLSATANAHVQTIVQADEHGVLDLSFTGFHFGVHVDDPPQSGMPGGIFMNEDQLLQLIELGHGNSDDAAFVRRITRSVMAHKDGRIVLMVLSTDLKRVQQAMRSSEDGPWQNIVRDAFTKTLQGEVAPAAWVDVTDV